MPRPGRKTDYSGTTYESKFEATIAEYLDRNSCRFQYETLHLDYWIEIPRGYCSKCTATRPRINRVYTPDFILDNGVILEAKGRFTAEERKKHAALKEQHPELDIRMVFLYDNYMNKSKKTRYSQWCKQKNIQYTVGSEIPKEWMRGKVKSIAYS